MGTGTRQRARLLVSADGRQWRDVTPPLTATLGSSAAGESVVESADFLNPSTGWVTTWSEADESVALWNTVAGGRTWGFKHDAAEHGFSAGDATKVVAVSRTSAYLFTQEPNGPLEILSRTSDGVHLDSRLGNDRAARGWPYDGSLEFTSDAVGFSAGVGFGQTGLVRTADGGRTWQSSSPPLERPSTCPGVFDDTEETDDQCSYTVPSLVTSELLTSTVHVHVDTAAVTVGRSSDNGRSWTTAGRVSVATERDSSFDFGDVIPAAAFASPDTWWVVTTSGDHLVTAVTTDAGAHWSTNDSATPGSATQLLAASGTEATAVISSNGSHLLETRDSGRSWSPIQP